MTHNWLQLYARMTHNTGQLMFVIENRGSTFYIQCPTNAKNGDPQCPPAPPPVLHTTMDRFQRERLRMTFPKLF